MLGGHATPSRLHKPSFTGQDLHPIGLSDHNENGQDRKAVEADTFARHRYEIMVSFEDD
jgi:hypothetical protein